MEYPLELLPNIYKPLFNKNIIKLVLEDYGDENVNIFALSSNGL